MKFKEFLEEGTGEKLVDEIFIKLINQIPVRQRPKATPVIQDELYTLLNSGKLNLMSAQELFARYGANTGLVKQFF